MRKGVTPALSVVYEGYEFKWMNLAREKGVGFPIGKPAQAKLIRDTSRRFCDWQVWSNQLRSIK
jgi:hypothetical protein